MGTYATTADGALETLRDAFITDPHFAWSWHCNLAMTARGYEMSDLLMNDFARSFMRQAFEVECLDRDIVRDLRKPISQTVLPPGYSLEFLG